MFPQDKFLSYTTTLELFLNKLQILNVFLTLSIAISFLIFKGLT